MQGNGFKNCSIYINSAKVSLQLDTERYWHMYVNVHLLKDGLEA